MHAQPPRGFRDVEIRLDQRLMDALPFERLDRGRPHVERDLGVAFGLVEGGFDVVGIGGFCEIVAGAELDGLDGGRNAGKACQHDDQHLLVVGMQQLDTGQPRGAAELEVDHGKAEGSLLQDFTDVFD